MSRFMEHINDHLEVDMEMSALNNELYSFFNTADAQDSPYSANKIFFYQRNYNRTPIVSSDWLTTYTPFKMLAAVMSMTFQSVKPDSRAGISFGIHMARMAVASAARTRILLDEILSSTYLGYRDMTNQDTKFVYVLHATQTEEYELCKSAAENAHWEAQTMLSTMLTPGPNHKVLLYKNSAEPDKVIIIIDRLSVSLMHRIVGWLPVLFAISLPNLVIPPSPELFTAFTNMDADTFVTEGLAWLEKAKQISNSLAPLMARLKVIADIEQFRRTLPSVLSQSNTTRLTSMQNTIDAAEAQLRLHYTNLKFLMQSVYTIDNDAIDTLAAYFGRNNALEAVQRHSNSETVYCFVIRTTLQHYETEHAKAAARRQESNGHPTLARMIRAIFEREEYQINIVQGFWLQFGELRGDAKGYSAWGVPEPWRYDTSALRNPHLSHFYDGVGCWGQNGPMITQALHQCDYMNAFNIALAAVRSVNLLDGVACDYLWADLEDRDKRNYPCIRRVRDGAVLTIEQLIEETRIQEEGAQQ